MATHARRALWHARPGVTHCRARDIVRPTGGIVRGKFPSRKNGRMVHHEGLLELDAIYLFELSPHIAGYREQPLTIFYPDKGRMRRYTPDFELTLDTAETVLVEVKPRHSLEQPDVMHKLTCLREHFQRAGTRFVVLDDVVLRAEPRQSNARWIYHRAPRVTPTADAAQAAIERYRDLFPATVRAAQVLLAEAGMEPFSLLLAGLLHGQSPEPLSLETVLHVSKEAHDGWLRITQEHGF